MKNPVAALRRLWGVARHLPGGPWLLSHVLGAFVPYAGTVHPRILELEPGRVRVRMADRRSVRNHLRSVHAIALANLAEMTTGLAVTVGLRDDQRAILTRFSIHYHKKARGPITGVCGVGPEFPEGDVEAEVSLHDQAGVTVATAVATWRVGPA